MNLSELAVGKTCKIDKVKARGLLLERFIALGFFNGNDISVVRKGKKDKIGVYEVSKTLIALRKDESSLIEVIDP